MCLVISALLGALGINFYLNGFYVQAGIMAMLSIGLILFVIRNISCAKSFCSLNKKADFKNVKTKDGK